MSDRIRRNISLNRSGNRSVHRAGRTILAASRNVNPSHTRSLLSRADRIRRQPRQSFDVVVNVGRHVGRRSRNRLRTFVDDRVQSAGNKVRTIVDGRLQDAEDRVRSAVNRKRRSSEHDIRGRQPHQPSAPTTPQQARLISPNLAPNTPSPDVALATSTPLDTPPVRPASHISTILETPRPSQVVDFTSILRNRRRFISSDTSLDTIPERVITERGSTQDVTGISGNVVTTPPPERSLSVASGGSLTPVNVPDTIPTNTTGGQAQLRINSQAPVTPIAANVLQSPVVQGASLPGRSDNIHASTSTLGPLDNSFDNSLLTLNRFGSASTLSTIIEQSGKNTPRTAHIRRHEIMDRLRELLPESPERSRSSSALPSYQSPAGSIPSLVSLSSVDSIRRTRSDPQLSASAFSEGDNTSVIEATSANPIAEITERAPLQRARDRARQLQNLRGSGDLSPRHDAFGNVSSDNVSAHIIAADTLDNQSTNDVRRASVTNVAGVGAIDAPSAPAVINTDTQINIEASRIAAQRRLPSTPSSSSIDDALTLHAGLRQRGLSSVPSEITQSLPTLLPRQQTPLSVTNSALTSGGATPVRRSHSLASMDTSIGSRGSRGSRMDTQGGGGGLFDTLKGGLGGLGSAIVADQILGGNNNGAFAPADPIGRAIADNLAALPSQAGLTLGPDQASIVACVLQSNAATHQSGSAINSNLLGAFALSPLLPQFQGPVNQFVPTFNQGLRAQGAATLLRSQFHV